MAEESKFSKNERLGMFLASLGDVLKGDKNVVGNALNRKQFLEQKISEEKRKERYQNFIKDLDEKSKGDNPQYSRSFYDLAQALGPKGLDGLLLKKFESDERKAAAKPDTKEFLIAKAAKVGREGLTPQERQLYDDLIIRPTFIERQFMGAMGTEPINYGLPSVNDPNSLAGSEQPISVTTQEEVDRLPAGTSFVWSDGNTYTKQEQ